MELFERGALIASAVVGLSLAGWMFLHGYKAPTCPPIVAVPVTVVVPANVPVQTEPAMRPVVLAPEFFDESIVAAPAVSCRADSADLAAFMRGWISGRGPMGLDIDEKRGIAYVDAEHGVSAKLVCGDEAAWLLEYLRDQLRMAEPLTCCDGVCTAGDAESGHLVTMHFMPNDDAWALTSWQEIQSDEADTFARLRSTADLATARLAKRRCVPG